MPISTPALAAMNRCSVLRPRIDPGRVGVEPQHREAVAGERHLQLVFEPLGAGAVSGDGHRGAVGTALRQRLTVTAVVARDRTAGPVKHERHLTVRAHPDMAACTAGQEVRPAAAVQQHDRLAPLPRKVGERQARDWMQRVVGAAHVKDLDRRQRAAVDPPGQRQPPVAVHALRAWGRAARDQHRAVHLGTALGDCARVVTGVALVLVGALVLLVDDDHADFT